MPETTSQTHSHLPDLAMLNTTVKIALAASVVAAVGGPLLANLTEKPKGGATAVASAPAMAPNKPIAPPVQQWSGERAELFADAAGHFQASVEVESFHAKMLVDTGASIIALTYEDADRAGVRPDSVKFTIPVSTANGTAYAARVLLRSVTVNGIKIYDVEAVVMPRGALAQSLLGMSYLKKLASFEMGNGKLMMRR